MKKSWYWVLLIFAGSMLVGHALQTYFTGDVGRDPKDRNWLMIGEAALGLLIIAFGLYKQVRANRAVIMDSEKDILLKLDDE